MSDGYIYAGMEKYYEEEKRSDNKTKILKILVLVLALVFITEAVIYLVIMPSMASANITFSGLKTLDEKALLSECGFSGPCSWMKFDTAGFASRLSSVSGIESVSVEKKFPDQILVKVQERNPVAFSLVSDGDRTIPIQIDKNGVVFSVGREIPFASLPLITGLDLESVTPGMRIPSKYRALLEQINQIWQINPDYFTALSEIRIMPTSYGGYELMLYPMKSRTRILTDGTLSEETLQYMMVVLDVISSVETDVKEIDMRYGTVSYIK